MTYEMLFGKGKIQGEDCLIDWLIAWLSDSIEYWVRQIIHENCLHNFVCWLTGGGCVKRKLLEKIDTLKATLAAQMAQKNVTSHDKLLSLNIQLASSLPKYIRINQIAMAIDEAFEVSLS